ncbi:ankyrin repeat domain-containing protein [Burkholderia pseudomallei]|uniref:ankyrin repeat domain-containing protein n=1 Tax=Burkholderia pseudomallei TaxID=28450 RepID=UPI000F18D2E7|nr:ankyrin repeat domain-containing protein [Burkholderia pseudomallei]CAJ3077122.1 ankyrin [Burkholderia pseudomallei]VCK72481.1 ankyrin [Burkholderia pseudomallei]VCK79847.1 ankyrin [Burkholderia pseudomallei]VCK80158.1 ankyrin [Burkholderia pseudomallei]VCK80653.1 ankyrin [Burkholderia pseudomallei]
MADSIHNTTVSATGANDLAARRIAADLFRALDANDEARVASLWPSCDPNARNLAGETPLIAAARLGLPRMVKTLLPRSDPNAPIDEVSDADEKAYYGHTIALTQAIESGSLECVQLLAPVTDLSLNAQHYGVDSPLTIAASRGDVAITQALLPYTDDLFAPGGFNDYTAFHAAAASGHADCLRVLLAAAEEELGAEALPRLLAPFNRPLRFGLDHDEGGANEQPEESTEAAPQRQRLADVSPLMLAASEGHAECVQELLPFSEPWIPREHGSNALVGAIDRWGPARTVDPTEVVALLIDQCPPELRDAYHGEALEKAASRGEMPAARLLLDALGSNAKEAASRAMFNAIERGYDDVVKALLPHIESSVRDQHGRTPLMAAAESGQLACVRRLLPFSDPEAVNEQGRNALMLAAGTDESACVELLARHSDTNRVDAKGETALLIAARRGASGAVATLAQCRDVDVEHRAPDGRTALMWAAKRGEPGSVEALLPHADPLARDREGKTALMLAASYGHGECVEALAPVSPINASDRRGRTALMFAARSGEADCLQPLLAANARQDLADRDGCDALRYALDEGSAPGVDLLAAGAPLAQAHRALDKMGAEALPATAQRVQKAMSLDDDALFAEQAIAQRAPSAALAASVSAAEAQSAARAARHTAAASAAAAGPAASMASVAKAFRQFTGQFTARALHASTSSQSSQAPTAQAPLAQTPNAASANGTAQSTSGAPPVHPAAFERWPDPRAVDAYGKTALMRAVEADDLARVNALLPVSDVNAKDERGQTALMIAASRGRDDCVKALAPVSNPNARDRRHGWTALMFAADRGHVDCVQALAPLTDGHALGRAPRWSGSEQCDAMLLAIRNGDPECVKALIPVSDLGRYDDNGRTPLARAVGQRQISPAARLAMVESLLAAAPERVNDCDHDGETPTVKAAQEHQWALAERLFAASDLAAAINPQRHPELVALTLAIPAERFASMLQSKLDHADEGQRKALDALIEATAQTAAASGWPDTLRALKPFANVNALTSQGQPMLHAAIASGSVECVQALLEEPGAADGRARSVDGLSPMEQAIRGRSAPIVDALGPHSTGDERQLAFTFFAREQLPGLVELDERDALMDVVDTANASAAASLAARVAPAPLTASTPPRTSATAQATTTTTLARPTPASTAPATAKPHAEAASASRMEDAKAESAPAASMAPPRVDPTPKPRASAPVVPVVPAPQSAARRPRGIKV